jgi:peptide chain release factor 2
MSATELWNDPDSAQATISKLKALKSVVTPIQEALYELGEVKAAYDLNLDYCLDNITQLVDKLELLLLLKGKNDDSNCFVQIHAGVGGTEAEAWAEMLLSMYLHFITNRGWKVDEVDKKVGKSGGIKNITLYVEGSYAYGYLSNEIGIHRLTRYSPFNAQNKLQTSFASVDVVPEFEETKLDIPIVDLEIIPFVRAKGPGGQKVNKTASAIRIIHLPTGLQVVSSVERSQAQNKKLALSLLLAKLERIEQAKRDKEAQALYGNKGAIAWGNQIRSYSIDENRVKDHRTGVQTNQVTNTLSRGLLDEFIDAELKRRASQR